MIKPRAANTVRPVIDRPDGLIPTGEAAKALGVSRKSLARWAQQGRVTPAWITPGGQYRWDLDDLKRQVRQMPRDPE